MESKSPLAVVVHLIMVLLGVLPAPQAGAGELVIDAERLFVGPGGTELRAEGTARARTDALSLSADRFLYDVDTETLRAEGSVVVRDAFREFRSEDLSVELRGRRGTAGAGSFVRKPDGLRVDAERFSAGPSRIELGGCTVTTCAGAVPAWSIGASRAWAGPTGLLGARGATFRIRDVPLLYAPYLAYPVLDLPRTGFLLPLVGQGERDGFRYFQPFYWLIAPDRDATATVEYRSDRAWGGHLEYRMLFGASGRLTASVHVVDDWDLDRTFVSSRLEAEYAGENGRTFVRGLHLTEQDFFREFSRSFDDRILRYVESAGETSLATPSTRAWLAVRLLQNLDGPSGTLPMSFGAGTDSFFFPGPAFPGEGALSVRWSNTVGTRIRTDGEDVHMLRVHPRVELPFGLNVLSGGLFADGYAEGFTEDADPRRKGLGVSGGVALEIGTRLERRFGAWSHVVEPRLRYDHRASGGTFAEDLDTGGSPGSVRLIGGALTNRFFHRGRQFGILELAAGIDPGKDADEWEPLRVLGMLGGPLGMTLELRYDPNDAELSFWSSSIRVELPKGYLLVGHRYDGTEEDAETTTASTVEISHALSQSLHAAARLWYDVDGGGVREFLVRASWIRDCWGIGVSFVRQLEEDRVLASFFLKGLGYLGSADLFPPLP